jgi:predicted permease
MVIGDLEEQFQERVEAVGPLRARAWYWREAVQLSWGFWRWADRSALMKVRVIAFDDLKYAGRRLRKQPLATVASVVTLALAIGTSAATWSLVSTLLLHPLDVKKPHELFVVGQSRVRSGVPQFSRGFKYPVASTLLKTEHMPIAAVGSIGPRSPLLVQTTGEARARSIVFATSNFLDVLGVTPAQGRFFSPAEDSRSADLTVVLSDRFWRSEFHADPAVIGRAILVRDQSARIVGVLPRSFRSLDVGRAPDLYMPLHTIDRVHTWEGLYDNRVPLHWIDVVGRLPEGISADQIEERFSGLGVESQYGDRISFQLLSVETASLSDAARQELTQFTTLLGGTVGLILAIGALTVGMLLVMRTEARAGEFAMCLALGASRVRLGAGVFVEGLVLATLGALLALPVSQLAFLGMAQFQLPGSIRMDRLDLALDGTVLLGAAMAAMLSVLAIAVLAGLMTARRNYDDVLRSHAGATPRVTKRRSRAALVTAQVAVTLVLVSGAGLFASSVLHAFSLNPGLDTDRLLWTEVDPASEGQSPVRAMQFVEDLRTRLNNHQAVASAAFWSSKLSMPITVDGQPVELASGVPLVAIDDTYVQTVGLPVLAGRDILASDREGTPRVALVSVSLAKAIAGEGNVLGRRIGSKGMPHVVEVVGVVGELRTPGGLEPKSLYMPMRQYEVPIYPGSGGTNLVIRPAASLPAATAALMTTVRELDPAIRPGAISTLDERISGTMAPQKFGLTVMGALATIALLLSVLGVYVIAESVAIQRRLEMGIRAALGATGSQLGTLLLSDTARLVGGGLVLGFGLSWLGAGTIRSFLFQVEPFDPVVTLSAAGTIIALSLVVGLRPALAASRLDLSNVLRDD